MSGYSPKVPLKKTNPAKKQPFVKLARKAVSLATLVQNLECGLRTAVQNKSSRCGSFMLLQSMDQTQASGKRERRDVAPGILLKMLVLFSVVSQKRIKDQNFWKS